VPDLSPTPGASSIVEDLEGFFSRFLVLSSGLPLVLALWSLATHLHESFDAFPYLAITSPTKRCGKTRVCELLGMVCLNPLQTVSISPPALYRLLKAKTRTLIIDEAEYLARKNDERASTLREILNAGYRKGQVVMRCKKTTREKSKGRGQKETQQIYETESFGTFCPKVLVLIGRLQDTLADRCIENRMERRAGANVERFRFARVQAEAAPLREAAEEYGESHGQAVENYYQNNDVKFVQDREAELWLPLFSVCAVAAPDRLAELEATARRLSAAKSEDEPGDYGILMLKDLREAFAQTDADRIPTSDLLETINSNQERPWAGWNDGRGVTSHTLSRLLRPFTIHPQNIRLEDRVVKGYLRQSLQECWERYL
jgi:Protein of unknown function (DUF3631)